MGLVLFQDWVYPFLFCYWSSCQGHSCIALPF